MRAFVMKSCKNNFNNCVPLNAYYFSIKAHSDFFLAVNLVFVHRETNLFIHFAGNSSRTSKAIDKAGERFLREYILTGHITNHASTLLLTSTIQIFFLAE